MVTITLTLDEKKVKGFADQVSAALKRPDVVEVLQRLVTTPKSPRKKRSARGPAK